MRSALLRLGQRRDRAHVVQAVGELDEQDAHVLRHRDEHLAHRRRLLRLLRIELEPVELGDPVDDRRDVVAEVVDQVVERELRVLDRVVQERARERDLVEAEVGEDQRHAERVRDVRVARAAHLIAVRVARDYVGPFDQRDVGVGPPRDDPVDEWTQRRGRSSPIPVGRSYRSRDSCGSPTHTSTPRARDGGRAGPVRPGPPARAGT